MNFNTKQLNIESIVSGNLEFLIPVYQRPYVWDDIEIKKLLEDLKYNFQSITENEYFVGNIYAIKSNRYNKSNQYEVIDGQQRFTTFWLISLCFKTLEIETELTKYLEIEYKKNKDIRFDFDIRKEVYEYLKGLLDGTAERRFHDVSNLEFLKNIAIGIKTIEGFLLSEIPKDSLKNFGNYIYKNVNFIFNEAPENTDLNALFVALGTSGIQLQQSDILKARLLDKLEKGKRVQYSKIWEACENMNNYFENNVKLSFPYDTNKVVEKDFKEYKDSVFNSNLLDENTNNYTNITINEIINLTENTVIIDNQEKDINTECRSIITFNMFLLHVFRVYRKGNNDDIESMDSKKMLQIIKLEDFKDSSEVAEFIELMWKARYLFDKHIVKWLNDEDESLDEDEKLLLSAINTKESRDRMYFSRIRKDNSNLQTLQSVLYFNNMPAQFWLTPFLNFLLDNENVLDPDILKELERIDNIMIPGDKKDSSWLILNNRASEPNYENIKPILKESSGTGFNHYWFYKLEYLLWKDWDKNNDAKIKNFRITSKNSVEHVFPQNPEYKIHLNSLNDELDWLNSFGNLTLLSAGQNSSYSNQDVAKKKIDFERKDTYDSLKLAKIYTFENWNTEEIKKHQEEMVTILEKHYS